MSYFIESACNRERHIALPFPSLASPAQDSHFGRRSGTLISWNSQRLSLPFRISQPGVKAMLGIYCKGQRNLCGPHLYNWVHLAWSVARRGVPRNDERAANGKTVSSRPSPVLGLGSELSCTSPSVDAESFKSCSPTRSSAGEQMLISLNWMQIYFSYLHNGIQNH